MVVVASLCTAILVGIVVGALTGVSFTPHRRRPGRQTSSRRWLLQAGLDLTPAQFHVASAGAGLAAFVLLLVITRLWVVSLPPALLVAALPRAYFGRLRQQRLAAVQGAWPDGLRDVVASISSGMSVGRAVEQLAASGPEPLRRAFSRYPFLARSVGVSPALEVIRENLADPTSDRVIEVLVLAHERGGAVVPGILIDLADATSREIWTREEIESEALEQKINARAVFVLPWLVLVAITLEEGPFRRFYASAGGLLVVLAGAVLSALGIWWVSRLSGMPLEPRVLSGEGRR